MFGHIVLVMLNVLLVQLSYGQRYGDPCTIMPNGPDFGEVQRVQANSSCHEAGAIWWNYPMGTLEVEFRFPSLTSPFEVCLTPDIGPYLSSLTDLSGAQSRPVHNPQKDQTTCVRSQHQAVVLGLLQPPFQTYMTLYRYTVRK